MWLLVSTIHRRCEARSLFRSLRLCKFDRPSVLGPGYLMGRMQVSGIYFYARLCKYNSIAAEPCRAGACARPDDSGKEYVKNIAWKRRLRRSAQHSACCIPVKNKWDVLSPYNAYKGVDQRGSSRAHALENRAEAVSQRSSPSGRTTGLLFRKIHLSSLCRPKYLCPTRTSCFSCLAACRPLEPFSVCRTFCHYSSCFRL